MIPLRSPVSPGVLFLAILLYFVVRNVVVTGAGMLLLRTRLAQVRRVYQRTWGKGQLASELRAGLLVLVFDAVAVWGVRMLGLHAFVPSSLRVNVFTFALLFVWFEVWFYATHRLLHTKALYWIHAQHHVAKVTHPLTSMSFGLVERAILMVGLLGFAVALSHVLPLSMAGLAGYYLFNFVVNVLVHLNVELFPEGYARTWLGRVWLSVTFHAMHHARYTGHYGLFVPLLDRWFGTQWEDYPEVQARAARGEGLKTLGERVVPGSGPGVGSVEPGLTASPKPPHPGPLPGGEGGGLRGRTAG